MGSSTSKSTLEEGEEKLLNAAEQRGKKSELHDISALYDQQIQEWNKFQLNFALIGSSGSEKSSFFNHLSG